MRIVTDRAATVSIRRWFVSVATTAVLAASLAWPAAHAVQANSVSAATASRSDAITTVAPVSATGQSARVGLGYCPGGVSPCP